MLISYGVVVVVVGWLAHEIFVSAQGPFLGFKVLGLRVWGQGLTIERVGKDSMLNLIFYHLMTDELLIQNLC